ncbi:MAG: FkbM family methyltransferase, partial [Deltaproteobacteria bacterium]|nr:FkbM family methyltransferase [Deltaproteobacteria bacterium]
MADNISLEDINTFTIQAPNKKDIIYNFCPQESWVLKGLFWSGKPNFEKDTAEIFFDRAVKARTILDIGANLGYYTYLAAAANTKARVIAFEPIKYLAEKVRDNSLLNGFAQVTVIDQAVSDKKGEAPFYINVKSPTMSTLS